MVNKTVRNDSEFRRRSNLVRKSPSYFELVCISCTSEEGGDGKEDTLEELPEDPLDNGDSRIDHSEDDGDGPLGLVEDPDSDDDGLADRRV